MHAPVDIKKKYLPLLRDAVAARKVYWEALPALEDRIAIEEGRRQKYGTQVATDERGVYYLLPVENCDSLESWRRKAGLPPMRDFLKGSDITWDPEHHRKIRPKIEAALTPQHLLYDLIYNPEETLFLKQGKAHGATTKNGLEMLHLQAEASWQIWQGNQPIV